MSILDLIQSKEEWIKFFNYKLEKGHLTKKEIKEFEVFVNEEKYRDIASLIKNKDFNFSVPTKKIINKMGTNKKRTVYYYNEIESMILKFITHHLFEYDSKMSSNCYSFNHPFLSLKYMYYFYKI